jgi:hypothetical protein
MWCQVAVHHTLGLAVGQQWASRQEWQGRCDATEQERNGLWHTQVHSYWGLWKGSRQERAGLQPRHMCRAHTAPHVQGSHSTTCAGLTQHHMCRAHTAPHVQGSHSTTCAGLTQHHMCRAHTAPHVQGSHSTTCAGLTHHHMCRAHTPPHVQGSHSTLAHQLPQVGGHGAAPVPLQQPHRLVGHDDDLVLSSHAPLHHVGKVPVAMWGSGSTGHVGQRQYWPCGAAAVLAMWGSGSTGHVGQRQRPGGQ